MANLAINGGPKAVNEQLGKALYAEWPEIGQEEKDALMDVLESRKWWRGGYTEENLEDSYVVKFENAFSEYQGAKYAVACTNGTQAIEMALKALEFQGRAVAAYKAELTGLNVLQETRPRGMEPEFMELKLRSRERLAEAERSELQALVDYNSALIELRRITGTVLDLPGLKVSLP